MKNKARNDESYKPGLIFQNYNPINFKFKFNQKAQFSSNLVLKYIIIYIKKINLKILSMQKKIVMKIMRIKSKRKNNEGR